MFARLVCTYIVTKSTEPCRTSRDTIFSRLRINMIFTSENHPPAYKQFFSRQYDRRFPIWLGGEVSGIVDFYLAVRRGGGPFFYYTHSFRNNRDDRNSYMEQSFYLHFLYSLQNIMAWRSLISCRLQFFGF